MTRNMMMTQSYYGGAEYDPYHRPSSHRSMSTAAYYDRHAPYNYYDQPRQEMRAEYGGRPVTRTMIHELETDGGPVSSRKRIGVACSRCRRRKIKCSGKPDDGNPGCHACRAAGADVSACTFDRVGSTAMGIAGAIEAYPQASSASSAPPSGGYGAEAGSSGWAYNPNLHTRPSLPTLHTRSSWMENYDPYEHSPIDYTYASSTIPRQDSFASSYGSIENYRSWITTAPMSAPVTASYYEQPTYSFGSLQTPSYTAGSSGRLPSVTADALSPLNMGSLHSSLPIQTAQERRLPVPYTIQYPTTTYPSQVQIPEVRPLTAFNEPRAPVHGIHSRNAMPWSMASAAGSTRTASVGGYAGGLPSLQSIQPTISVAPISEPVLGYQFDMNNQPTTTVGSPNISPTTTSSLTESYPSTASATLSMPPPPNFRYAHPAPLLSVEDQTSADALSREAAAASLYSFSKDTSTERPVTSGSDQASSSSSATSTASGQVYTTERPQQRVHYQHQQQQPRRHQQETPRRTSSFEQQQQRAATAHRMSVSNLNARY